MQSIPIGNFLTQEIEEPGEIVKGGLVLNDNLTFLIGPAKIGKSMFVSNIILSITRGTPLLNLFEVPTPQRVLYIQQEVAPWFVQNRFRSMIGNENPGELYLWNERPLRIDSKEHYAIIEKEIEEVNPTVIVLDPLRRFHHQDENSSQGMGYILETIEDLAGGRSVIIVHHTGIPNQDNPRKGGYMGRGSSVLYDAGAAYILLRPTLLDHVHIVDFSKRYKAPIPSLIVERNVTLGYSIVGVSDKTHGDVVVAILKHLHAGLSLTEAINGVSIIFGGERVKQALQWMKEIQ